MQHTTWSMSTIKGRQQSPVIFKKSTLVYILVFLSSLKSFNWDTSQTKYEHTLKIYRGYAHNSFQSKQNPQYSILSLSSNTDNTDTHLAFAVAILECHPHS